MKKQPLKEKLKAIGGGHLLNESTWDNRKFGEPLPTMADYKKAKQNPIKEEMINERSKWIKPGLEPYQVFDHMADALADMRIYTNKDVVKNNPNLKGNIRKINDLAMKLMTLLDRTSEAMG